MLDLATYFQAMRERLTGAQTVTDAELAQLAADRGAAIRGYMIEMQKTAPERVEVQEPDVNEEKGDWVRCKLALDGSD